MNSLKTIALAAIAIFIFSNATCDKKIKLVRTIDGGTITFTALPQAAGTFDFNQSLKFDMEAELKKVDIAMVDLTQVVPESATITIEDSTATPVTFDIVDYVNLELGNSNVANKRAVFKDPVPHTGLTTITPDVDPTFDVLALVQANDVNYHFTGKLNKSLDHQIKLKFAIKWKVTAELAP